MNMNRSRSSGNSKGTRAPAHKTDTGPRSLAGYRLDTRRDTLDFRDRMYEPTLVEVPRELPLATYLRLQVPVLDQGREGACTGFGLATVAHCLLRQRKMVPDDTLVSPRMFYELARRYDEWPGENYSGSSARGAMKGWHKHGVCSRSLWPDQPRKDAPQGLTRKRAQEAQARPLGAYLRVNHQDLVAMHSALAEVGVLYATASVHAGWEHPGADGAIPYPAKPSGGHAFAIVGYDAHGFWVQNSWGTGWGQGGFGRVGYDDWLANGTDVWVARLGAPVTLSEPLSSATVHSAGAGRSASYSLADLRPHIISLGNNGRLKTSGDFATTPEELRRSIEVDMPAAMKGWPQKNVLLYAHGGLVDEQSAVQRIAEYRATLLQAHIYPLGFVWHSDYWTTVSNILEDAMRRRRPEGVLDAAKDFLLDRLDDTLEVLARSLSGKAAWDEMKSNALAASDAGGGARLALDSLATVARGKAGPLHLHVAGHSAGSIFHAPLVRLLTGARGGIAQGYLSGQKGYGLKLDSCTLWAPACTTELFRRAYLPSVQDGSIGKLALFALTDPAEQDDNCAGIYHKSLLYLVSRAFEEAAFGPGTPILGMEKWLRADDRINAVFTDGRADLVLAPNSEPSGTMSASRASHHADFDDDPDTVSATFARMLAASGAAQAVVSMIRPAGMRFHHSDSSLRDRRVAMDRRSGFTARA